MILCDFISFLYVLWVSGLVFQMSGLVFWVSGLVFWMSGLVLWMSGLAVWMSGLVFWMSGLVFGCLDLYFRCLFLYFGVWTCIFIKVLEADVDGRQARSLFRQPATDGKLYSLGIPAANEVHSYADLYSNN